MARPLSGGKVAAPRAVARGLAEIAARAHAAGHVLGGIRPELVYARGGAIAAALGGSPGPGPLTGSRAGARS